MDNQATEDERSLSVQLVMILADVIKGGSVNAAHLKAFGEKLDALASEVTDLRAQLALARTLLDEARCCESCHHWGVDDPRDPKGCLAKVFSDCVSKRFLHWNAAAAQGEETG